MDPKVTELYNDYIHGDMPRRAALEGYIAVAPDGLSFVGGAPVDQEAAGDKFREADTATHGFHNDTSQARYDETAAKSSRQRTINFFNHYLQA